MNTYIPVATILDKTTWENVFIKLCTLPNTTKLFPNQRLCVKNTPSPNSELLPTNAQGSGFLFKTQQHCFQGEGGGENRSATKFRKNAPQICHFLNSFVQDCRTNFCKLVTTCYWSKWNSGSRLQTSLKLRIKLGWNHLNLNIILTYICMYNIYKCN